MTQEFTEAQLAQLIESAKEAAVSRHNPDVCGICGLHFNECEVDTYFEDYDEETGKLVGKEFFSCAGARLRTVFVESKKLLIKGGYSWWL
jgi:hypothetical protein